MVQDAMTAGVAPPGTAASLPPAPRTPTMALTPAASDTALVPVRGKMYSAAARRRYADFLPETEAIAQRRHSPYATLLLAVLSALVVAAVAWMHVARLDEVATAPGVVRWADKCRCWPGRASRCSRTSR
jgi:hypothetical protein